MYENVCRVIILLLVCKVLQNKIAIIIAVIFYSASSTI